MNGAAVELEGLRVVLGGRTVLDLGRLRIAAGRVTAVVGANGAGKSTLLRTVGGLRPAQAGTIRLDGRPAEARELRAVSAAVLQRPLLARGDVLRNVQTGLRFRRVPGRESRRRAAEWIERLGLAALAERPVAALSGGEAQRVSLARALVLEPRLLLLDEPFAALDVPTRGELLADLHDILSATATTALLVTHDPAEAAALGDDLAVLDAGALRQYGPVRDVLSRPADAPSARLLGYDNVLPPELAVRLGLEPPRAVAVRAIDIHLTPARPALGVLRRIYPVGGALRAVVEVDGHAITATASATDAGGMTPGAGVALEVDSRHVAGIG